MRASKALIALTLALAILLTGCAQFRQNAEERKYYTGYQGVNIDFEGNSPPSELFYRGEEVPFEVAVRVNNEGASLTKGGIYVSGYDPTIIDMKEVDENRNFFDNCNYDLRDIGYGFFQASLQCKRIPIKGVSGSAGISIQDGGVILSFNDLNLGDQLDNLFNTDFFTDAGFNESDIVIDTTNGGRFDVKFDNPRFDPSLGSRGRYFLSLWETFDFGRNQGKEFLLKGDNPRFPGGEEEIITFEGTVKQLPQGREETRQPIMITSCHLYSTYAAPSVCVDPRPYSQSEKTCRPSPISFSNGQGSPVAITNVQQKSTGNEMVFELTIRNMGRGTVYNPTRIQSCSPYYPLPATEQDQNVVVLGMVYIGDEMLECVPEKHTVRLYNGRGKAKCIYELDEATVSKSAYSTPLVAELWYGYSKTIRRTISIQRV